MLFPPSWRACISTRTVSNPTCFLSFLKISLMKCVVRRISYSLFLRWEWRGVLQNPQGMWIFVILIRESGFQIPFSIIAYVRGMRTRLVCSVRQSFFKGSVLSLFKFTYGKFYQNHLHFHKWTLGFYCCIGKTISQDRSTS